MVSLLQLAEITEVKDFSASLCHHLSLSLFFSDAQEGVRFSSPQDGSPMLLTPEHSIEIQNIIGADIIMQLDDVVHSLTTGPRVEEAMWRTLRWLDRYLLLLLLLLLRCC